ncbi:MAG: PQQ-binding-like beta-propeller repeat protein [Thermoguttaceae bacterium]
MNDNRAGKPRLLLALTGVLVLATAAAAENWPAWRGPRGDGISTEKNIPSKWSKTENVAWRLPLPGPAGSTPIVWEDRIFLTSVDGDDLVLLCVGTDGKQLWRQVVGTGNVNVRGDEGNSAAPSPSTDGKYVWVFFTSGDLACYDFQGEQIWKCNVQERYGRFKMFFGMSSTPVLYGERLYLQLIHSGGAKVIALDKNTGEEVWVRKRESDARGECEHAYASPRIYRDSQREYLLTHGADYIIAHDLAGGRELWRCGNLHPASGYNPTLRFVASPLAVPGMIVVTSAKKGPTIALRPDGSGDITDKPAYHLWRHDATPDVPSPLAVNSLVYLYRENGNLVCLDAKTGKQYYEERTHPGRHRASPVYADGKIFLAARDGRVTVVKPGKKFEIIAENDIQEPLTSSAVISGGRLYLRSYEALYAIGGK